MSIARAPLILTMPRAPRPGGVAMATIVSSVANIGGWRGDHLFAEMITVFMNASPMLSELAVGSSATAR